MIHLPISRVRRDWPLWLVAAAHLAFLLLFAAVLLLATARAQAETAKPATTCTGRDMLAEMAREQPQLMAAARAEAEAEPNARGLLWRVEKPGVAPSFLFGTMHVTDPRVTTLPPEAERAFEQAQTVVIETLDVLDPSRMTAILVEAPELMMFTDERALDALIPDDDQAMVEAALSERGMPLSSLRKTKPWIVSALLALPACELARQAGGAHVLDIDLANRAKAAGKALEGLESGREQLEAMASLSMDFHIEGLVETVRLGSRIDDVAETMVQIYRSGELGMFWPFFKAVLPAGNADDGYSAFQHAMITVRNRTMAERAAPILDKGGAFVAVGALHLPGADGVVSLLQSMGYAVSRAE